MQKKAREVTTYKIARRLARQARNHGNMGHTAKRHLRGKAEMREHASDGILARLDALEIWRKEKAS